MNIKTNIKKATVVALMTLAGTTAFAQHRHYYGHVRYYGYHRPAVVTVVNRPAVTTHVSNRLSKKDRLEMALAYLKNNKQLTISKLILSRWSPTARKNSMWYDDRGQRHHSDH